MISNPATVFSKEAKKIFSEKAIAKINRLIQAEKSILKPEKKQIISIPRNDDDFKMSSVLLDEPLPMYLPAEIDLLESYVNDFYKVPRDLRVKRVVCFDTETTNEYNAFAVSIALILYNIETETVEKEFYSLVNPLADISYGATEVHGISIEDVRNEKTFEELEQEITSIFREADMLIGHNVEFDLKVMEREYERINKVNPLVNVPYFDTMKLGKNTIKALDIKGKVKAPRLEEAVAFYGIEEPEGMYHNALVDTDMCLRVFRHMIVN